MLKIGDSAVFEDDWSHRRSSLMYFQGDQEEPAAWSVDIGFAAGLFQGEEVWPSLCVNPIETDKAPVQALAGASFSVASIEESCAREDSFYLYEHEPLVHYVVRILEIREHRAHIRCSGTLVVDGYASPHTTAPFEIDSWVPVIESVQDWDRFGL